MEIKQDTLADTEVFKLAPGDMDHLYRRSGLSGNSLSPFRYNAEHAATSSPSEFFKPVSESPKFMEIAKKLLEPELRIEFNRGGAGSAEEKYYVLMSADDEGALAQLFSTDGSILLVLFGDRKSFLNWWSDLYVSKGMGTYHAVFPGTMNTEVLVCALHCIDVYRRSYMESMLDYRSGVNLSLTTQDFVQLLKRALASKDKRWLLPTMFEITPGLKNSSIALKPEHIKQVEELGFISSNESELTLGERSKIMGTEFIVSWMGAIGCQATALISGEEKSLSRIFLAPTAFTNHLFSFEIGSQGENHFRHQASTVPELIKTLDAWMEALQKVCSTPAPAKTAKTAAPPLKFCGQCGAELKPGKKFCTSCGTAI